MPPCHRHMVIATNLSSLFDLLLCSTPQTWAECCLVLTAVSGCRMPVWVKPTPPIRSVRPAYQKNNSNGSTAGQPGPGLEPVFCGVCVQCISSLLLGRHQYHRFPNRPLPFPSLPLWGSSCPLVHITDVLDQGEGGEGGVLKGVGGGRGVWLGPPLLPGSPYGPRRRGAEYLEAYLLLVSLKQWKGRRGSRGDTPPSSCGVRLF